MKEQLGKPQMWPELSDFKQNGDIMGNIIGNVKDSDADVKKREEKFNVNGLNADKIAVGPHCR